MNRFGLPASWTALDLLEHMLAAVIMGGGAALFIGVIVVAFRRGLKGKEL